VRVGAARQDAALGVYCNSAQEGDRQHPYQGRSKPHEQSHGRARCRARGTRPREGERGCRRTGRTFSGARNPVS